MGPSPAAPARPGLPAERSSFIGRAAEVATVCRMVHEGRLVTVVGPGGVGKTRLALRAAAQAAPTFRDGAVLADLTTVRNPRLVARQVSAAMDVRDQTGRWPTAGLAEVVGGAHVLLVLDNCEHLRDAVAVVVHALTGACPHLHVLATSRMPLDVDGEALLVLPPMPVPEADDPGVVFASEAVQLLAQRARSTTGLEVSRTDAADLAELCRRLDGLPLAIEMASARLRTMRAADVVARLGDRFSLLRRSSATSPQRHRTLRATMEWSADLLTDSERLLWRRAAVFAGPFDSDAAEHVCADGVLPGASVQDALVRLVEASVLDVDTRPGGPRFRMLESVRAFGRERLEAAGEADAVLDRHLAWCAGMAAWAAREFIGPRQVDAFDRLTTNHAELSAALERCAATGRHDAVGLAMAADLWLYWEARGHLGEGQRWLATLLDRPQPAAVRARGLAMAGYLALAATDPDAAVPLLTSARRLARQARQPFVLAMATQYLGLAALFGGDLAGAARLLGEAAERHAEMDVRYAAFCWADIGLVALLAGRLDEATRAFDRSLVLNAGGDPWTRSHALWGLGLVRLRSGDADDATRLELAALRLMREVDDRSGAALCVGALAWAAHVRGDEDRAARLSGAADAIWRSIPAQLPAPVASYRDEYVAAVRARLGDRRWSARYGDGSVLDRASAVSLALGESFGPSGAAHRPGPQQLTPRQREVAALVAQGLTDREIAARLVISPRTAESHVEQIRARLGLRNRAELAAWTTAHP